MTSPDSIGELIARLEKATEGSRELDVLLGCLTDDTYELTRTLAECVSKFGLEWAVEAAGSHSSILRHTLPHFSTSIDAALALMERALPDWWWSVEGGGSEPRYCATIGKKGEGTRSSLAPTAPIAIVLALLAARRSLSSTERQ